MLTITPANVAAGTKAVEIAGIVVAVEKYENVNYHRPATGGDRDRYDENGDFYGVAEFCRMVLVQADDGRLYQWFGKSSTKFWQFTFSSKLDNPRQVGDSISMVGNVKTIKPADEHFGERAVVTHPRLNYGD